jgi:hypothetical protein
MAMYGVLRLCEVDPWSADALMWRINHDCVPLPGDVPGFVSSRITDSGTGKILWLTTFEAEAPARTWDEENDPRINALLGWYLTKPPQVLVGRVHSRSANLGLKARHVALAEVS